MEQLSLTGANRHNASDGLQNLSALIIEDGDLTLDNGAIHGKARVEKNIRFVTDRDEVPDPKRYVVIWLTLRRAVAGQGVNGLAASEFYIDSAAGVGFKSLADQVNTMDSAVKGKIDLAALSKDEHHLLKRFIRNLRPELWENATEAVWREFATADEIEPLRAKAEAVRQSREDIRLNAEAEKKLPQ